MSAPNPGFWKNKKVLVTGHTGFKGSWLSLWLSRMGAQVLGYSLAPESDPNLFQLSGLEKQIDSRLGDVRDLNAFRQVYDSFSPDIVLHLAAQALVRASYRDPVTTYATNVMGTVNVLEAARLHAKGGCKVFVNVTSDKCYENREWAWGYRENEAMGGYDPYSSSKGCSELVTSAYRRSFFADGKLGLASARAGNVIGGGDWAEDRLIPDCMRALLKGETIQVRNPHSIRPWQHVLEPLSGYLRLAEKLWEDPTAYAEGWNFGPYTQEARPVAWIAEELTRSWGAGAQWKNVGAAGQPHEAGYLKLDCSLAQARLGWEPCLGLRETLQWVVEWYQGYGKGKSALALTLDQIDRFQDLGRKQES